MSTPRRSPRRASTSSSVSRESRSTRREGSTGGAPRRRMDAAAARAAILDAAERRLVAAGPSGIRLQEVAADVGVSHPTVLHHFGSREALVKAVCARAMEAIHARLVEAIAASRGEEGQIATMLDGVYQALAQGGHGRVVTWMALEGTPIGADAAVRLADVVDATHALRRSKRKGKGRTPPRDDTAHTVVLGALALVGASVMGATMLANAGLDADAAAGARFRTWLARLLARHLDEEG